MRHLRVVTFAETESRRVGAGGEGKGELWTVMEFQFCKVREFWSWTVVPVGDCT